VKTINVKQYNNNQNIIAMFSCEEKMEREKDVRESERREKMVRNRVNLRYCMLQERNERNRKEKSLCTF
jgi:hypothetical protein